MVRATPSSICDGSDEFASCALGGARENQSADDCDQ
jgi:hypothetical protein